MMKYFFFHLSFCWLNVLFFPVVSSSLSPISKGTRYNYRTIMKALVENKQQQDKQFRKCRLGLLRDHDYFLLLHISQYRI